MKRSSKSAPAAAICNATIAATPHRIRRRMENRVRRRATKAQYLALAKRDATIKIRCAT